MDLKDLRVARGLREARALSDPRDPWEARALWDLWEAREPWDL